MDRALLKHMTYGKRVQDHDGTVYMLLEDADRTGANPEVYAVRESNLRRYELLRAWRQNWDRDPGFRERFTHNIDDCVKEFYGLRELISLTNMDPADKIRFITSDYKTLFEVNNLDFVKVNGEEKRAIFLDSHHFKFENEIPYHICEFAEICERHNAKVEPVSKELSMQTTEKAQVAKEWKPKENRSPELDSDLER